MTSCSLKNAGLEYAVLSVLGIGFCASITIMITIIKRPYGGSSRPAVELNNAVLLDVQALEKSAARAADPVQSGHSRPGLMVGEFRVIAIGSSYPIPYEAERCPFSDIPQPALNQLDYDGDEITDDWELKFSFNKHNAADALLDPDDDGFNNLEEFKGDTDPRNAASHPSFATKLRFIDRKDIPFFLVFQGFTQLEDGSMVFQLNNPSTGKSHFISIEEEVEGVVVQRFEPADSGRPARLFVRRGSSEIELIRGETSLDPKSKAELINILDQTPVLVTMGALLSLHSDEYMVLGVYPDKVILREMQTGNVFEIIGLAEGKP